MSAGLDAASVAFEDRLIACNDELPPRRSIYFRDTDGDLAEVRRYG